MAVYVNARFLSQPGLVSYFDAGMVYCVSITQKIVDPDRPQHFGA